LRATAPAKRNVRQSWRRHGRGTLRFKASRARRLDAWVQVWQAFERALEALEEAADLVRDAMPQD
jgi:hypothetical protein